MKASDQTTVLDRRHRVLSGVQEIRNRVHEYEVGEGLATADEIPEPAGTSELLLAENGVQVLPHVRVLFGGEDKRLRLPIGATIAEVREFCGVPVSWSAKLDGEPVGERYPIIRDSEITFKPCEATTLAGVCHKIREDGHCQQREDDRAWIGFTDLYTNVKGMKDVKLSSLTTKELMTLLRQENIRHYNPSRRRLLVHCGDWMHYLAWRARQEEQVLDAAQDPEAITGIIDDMKATHEFYQRMKKRKG
jgi:hypothetical protein